ncbi:MAG: HAMP domain-containing sensor histidine kinase [Pseudomonadota bacterium]
MKLGTKLLIAGISLVVIMTTVIIYVVNVNITERQRKRIISDLLVSASNYEVVLNNKERELAIHIRTFFQEPLAYQAPLNFHAVIESYFKDIGYADRHLFGAVFHKIKAGDELQLNLLYPPAPEGDLPEYYQELRTFLNTVQSQLPLDDVLIEGQLFYSKTFVLDGRLFRVQGIPIREEPSPPKGALFLFSEVTDSFARSFILETKQTQDDLKTMQERLGEKAKPETVFLVQGQATPVATTRADFAGLTEFSEFVQTKITQAENNEEIFYEVITLEGEDYVGLWRPWITGTGYLLLKSYDDAIAPLRALQRKLLILGFVVMLIAIIVTLWITRSLVLPISRLVEGTQAVEAGNLETVVPVTSKDEIGHLTQSFNHMVSQVREKEKVEAMLAQKEIERHRSISEMVTGVAHEINTPLGIVNSSANLIEMALDAETVSELSEGKDEDTEETLNDLVEACQLIQSNIERASRLVQRFKSISVEQLTDSLETVDLVDKLDEQLMLYKVGARNSKLDIAVKSQLAEKQWQGYPGYLFQIMQNLLSNIDRYAYSDGGKVVVSVKSTREKGVPSFLVSVQDFGAGMSEESVSRIFDAFYTTGRNQGGSGLGMAIVHNIVTSALKGSIEVSSQLGKGTTFTLCFPQILTE